MSETETRPVLVLIGAPGAGKTKVGKRVARLLGAKFVDTDRRFVAKHGKIADIFARFGEPYFRALERIEVSAALRENAVVALGGGAVLNEETQRDLAGHRVVLLTVSAQAVIARIGGTKRPLLRNGVDDWQRLVDERRDTYQRLATRTWDTSDASLDTVAAEIAAWVTGQHDQERLEAPDE